LCKITKLEEDAFDFDFRVNLAILTLVNNGHINRGVK
jgi:hypothetical protein